MIIRWSNGLYVYLIALLMTIMGAIWHIDLSLSALINNDEFMTNGFHFWSPMQIYHVALYTLLVSVFLLGTLAVYGISRHDARV